MKSRIILLVAVIWLGYLSRALANAQWPLTVTNIAELKSLHIADVEMAESALSASTSPAVYVLGYYAPGDRGGGMFEWDQNSSRTPDSGRFFTTNGWSSGNGRWVRRFAGEVPNVKMWGAKGDINVGDESPGTVASATDDTSAIQSAINGVQLPPDVGSFTSEELLFPAGWYKITNTLIFNQFLKLRGENARMTHIVMPYGINKDILRSIQADQALNGATNAASFFDENVRIEDISLDFATQFATDGVQQGHNLTNSGIVIINPDEGNTIRNVTVDSAGIGIRCFGGGGGAPAAFRDVVCTHCAIAGICIEPVPGTTSAWGHVSITGITSDSHWDDSRSNVCLVKFVDFVGNAIVEDLNAEGVYGGGVIQSQFPSALSGWQLGMISVRNCEWNSGGGASWSGLLAPNDFLVLKSGGNRTTAITMENVQIFGGNMIRDEMTGRNVVGLDADGKALNQAICRIPVQYESWNLRGNNGDGTPAITSRLVVGDQIIYSFIPPTNGWYRIMAPGHGYRTGGRVTVASEDESSEFNVDVITWGSGADLARIDVTRATKDSGGWPAPPCVKQVRAGVYSAPSGDRYPFVDIDVEYILADNFVENASAITLALPVYDERNVQVSGGNSSLLNPTTPLSSIVPSGCTLVQSVTNSLVR